MARNKTKQEPVEIEVVIDRSGSMGMVATDAIGGYNQWLSDQQALPGEANLTLTLFDHEHNTRTTCRLQDATPLDAEQYVPRGSTALNDAMGRALARLEAKNPAKAILVVLTDGQENASKEFTHQQVKDMVGRAQAKGWQIVYLSADINGFLHGMQYGVQAANTLQVAASGAGMRAAMGSASQSNTSYRNGGTLSSGDDSK